MFTVRRVPRAVPRHDLAPVVTTIVQGRQCELHSRRFRRNVFGFQLQIGLPCLVHEHFDGETVVARQAVPAACGCFRVDADAMLTMYSEHVLPIT